MGDGAATWEIATGALASYGMPVTANRFSGKPATVTTASGAAVVRTDETVLLVERVS